jgi:hypothetical protein
MADLSMMAMSAFLGIQTIEQPPEAIDLMSGLTLLVWRATSLVSTASEVLLQLLLLAGSCSHEQPCQTCRQAFDPQPQECMQTTRVATFQRTLST